MWLPLPSIWYKQSDDMLNISGDCLFTFHVKSAIIGLRQDDMMLKSEFKRLEVCHV